MKHITHACLIESLSENERRTLALEIAAGALCETQGEEPCRACRHCAKVFAGIHPDVTEIERESGEKGKKRREIYVSQVREVIADSVVLPNEARRRVYLFTEADMMNRQAQNALLKLLEEPPAHVLIILCVENSLALLDTVRSRCLMIRKNAPTAPPESEASMYAREYLAHCAAGDALALARFCSLRETMDADTLAGMVSCARSAAAAMLCLREPDLGMSRKKIARLDEELKLAERYLQSNVGVKHVLGLLSALGAVFG